MPKDGKIKFVVVSDLHAEVADASQDTRLLFGDGEFAKGIIDSFAKNASDVDYLICAGDISNQSRQGGLEAGWDFIKKLAQVSRAKGIFVVPGNHDHDSRLQENVYCPKHKMQHLIQDFPYEGYWDNTHFWAWNWNLTSYSDFNVVILNSSAFHGYSGEWAHGRVSHETSDQILKYLKSNKVEKKLFNILLTHHHPVRMDHVDAIEDYQSIDGGGYLIEKLQEAKVGPWMIVHGHKHFPDIKYGQSRSTSKPVIFSSGSLSARLYPAIRNRTNNQYYIVEIDCEETKRWRTVTGQFFTYEWTPVSGWRKSESNSLPCVGGFGAQLDVSSVLGELSRIFSDGRLVAKAEDLVSASNLIKYLMPEDIEVLSSELEQEGYLAEFMGNDFVEVGRNEI
ncbi:MAG: hypothetical protein CMI02_14455 [Oceanospirillaceae bacterium]|nr:hypothetical protein [Oceanospirillaceae bacterium]MBT13224.1 hypothetical protein [Oceanospirillaceae bacterium]|tara:strand:+ start:40847 stop:42028 length:1182 start_codon:yes stop_codon:yes gene_type:complete